MPGGTLLQAAGGYCTSGIGVRNLQGTRFMLTAGHCYREIGNPWYTRPDNRNWNTNPTQYLVGNITQDGFSQQEDVGFLNSAWADEYVNTSLGYAPLNASAVAPSAGTLLCKTGMTLNYTCHVKVIQASYTYGFSNFPGQTFQGFNFCSDDGSVVVQSGDSGGPIYAWTNNYTRVSIVGLTSGSYAGGTCGVAVTVASVMTNFGLVIDNYGLA
jgi:hypothetical protein